MALTLEQYITYLDSRGLTWPMPPQPESPRAKPHLMRLPEIRVVTWNPYGTLLSLAGGELLYEHPKEMVLDLVLEKVIQEFKMWQSMSRKPGQPAEYFRPLYLQALNEQRTVSGRREKHPEVAVDKVWEALIKKLLQKDYRFDAGFYGSLNEFSCKVAYFFHASLQGIAATPGALNAVSSIADGGRAQALLGNAQCFTLAQISHCLSKQNGSSSSRQYFDPALSTLSCELKVRPPSEILFRHALDKMAARRIKPHQVLHIGTRVDADIVPARRLAIRTALFAGDKGSLRASGKQLGQEASRPDILLTELAQLPEVIR
jgi:hypothetical protein